MLIADVALSPHKVCHMVILSMQSVYEVSGTFSDYYFGLV